MSLVQLGSHFRIEEYLNAEESGKGKGKEIIGSSSVNMIEDGKNNNNNKKSKGKKRKNDGNDKDLVVTFLRGHLSLKSYLFGQILPQIVYFIILGTWDMISGK